MIFVHLQVPDGSRRLKSEDSTPTDLLPLADSTAVSSLDFQSNSLPLVGSISGGVDKLTPPADEQPEVEETWPGKVCAFCNLGERSQLGCGEMVRLEVGNDFEALRQNYQPPPPVPVTPNDTVSLFCKKFN